MATHSNLGNGTTGVEAASLFPSSIRDKTIIVTGVARTGIGGTTALALASQAPRLLILSGRDATKVQGVVDDINEKYPEVKTQILKMDLSSQASVRQAAASLKDVDAVDLLINNAGVMGIAERTLNAEGIEMQFATNHIGHFLFTNLIREKLVTAAQKAGNKPGAVRIVNVSSSGHGFSPVRFSDINFDKTKSETPESEWPNYAGMEAFGLSSGTIDQKTYLPFAAYGQSKTANILFSLQLQKLLGNKHGITSFALHPGGISTDLQRHADPAWLQMIWEKVEREGLTSPRKSLESGCSTTIVAACDPGLEGKRENVYLDDCQVVAPSAEWARDEGAAEKLWGLSEGLVGEKFAW